MGVTSKYFLYYHGYHTWLQNFASIYRYVDSNWASDIDSRRSSNGCVFIMDGGSTSWMSKGQVAVALSMEEAEYMEDTHSFRNPLGLDGCV